MTSEFNYAKYKLEEEKILTKSLVRGHGNEHLEVPGSFKDGHRKPPEVLGHSTQSTQPQLTYQQVPLSSQQIFTPGTAVLVLAFQRNRVSTLVMNLGNKLPKRLLKGNRRKA
jgi:hypothetical protein